MAAIQFPNNPNTGDLFTASNGIRYTYDGEKWKTLGTSTVGTEGQFLETPTSLTIDKVIPANTNTGVVGPMAISAGITLSIPATSTFRTLLGKSVGIPTSGGTFTGPVNLNDTLTGTSAFFSNNVGIGTTTPDAKLHVYSTAINQSWSDNAADLVKLEGAVEGINLVTSSTGFISFSDAGARARGVIEYLHSSDSMQFDTAGSEKMRINSDGNVGIGTSSPQAKLDVLNIDATAYDALSSSGQIDKGSSLYVKNQANTNVAFSQIVFGQRSSAELCRIVASGGSAPFLAFTTADAERMRITSTGNVGIGTTDPEAKLEVAGAIVASDAHAAAYTRTGVYLQYLGSSIADIAAYRSGGSSCELSFSTTTGTGVPVEKVRISAGGNVGIGTSTPGTYAGGSTLALSSTGGARIGLNATGRNYYIGGDSGSDRLEIGRRIASNTADSADIVLAASGNVGIGTTGPDEALHISAGSQSSIRLGQAGGNYAYRLRANVSSTVNGGFYIEDAVTGYDCYRVKSGASGLHSFYINNIEKMRIDNGGRLLLGTSTGYDNNYKMQVAIPLTGGIVFRPNSSATKYPLAFQNNSGSFVGSVKITTTTTTYNTSSDYRLKENIVDISDGITRVKQLAPKRFNFIVDTDTTVDGFIAHEAQTVVPEAITGTKDEVDADGNAVMQGIDQSKLVPLLTAALQEAIAKIETLETKVAALEAG